MTIQPFFVSLFAERAGTSSAEPVVDHSAPPPCLACRKASGWVHRMCVFDYLFDIANIHRHVGQAPHTGDMSVDEDEDEEEAERGGHKTRRS